MLADAVRAEGYRLGRNRTALFWSLIFVPVMSVVLGAIGAVMVKGSEAKLSEATGIPPQLQAMFAATPINLADSLVSAAASAANPAVLLFLLIGAATLYAGDYRWETWRLISARNSRPNLLLGKLTVVAGLALGVLVLMLIAGLIESVIRAGVFDRSVTFRADAGQIGDMAALFGLSWLRVVQFAMIGLLAAVMTRSLLAALFIPLAVGVGQALSPQMLMPAGVMPTDWLAILVNPGAATDAIGGALRALPLAPAPEPGLMLKSWISLLLWTALPLAAALAWFQRQDLSKE